MTLVNTLSPPLQDMMSNLAYLPCFYLSQLKETSACICSTWQAPTWTVETSLHSSTFIPMPQPGSRLSRLLYVQVLPLQPQPFGHTMLLPSLLVTPGPSPAFWSRQAPPQPFGHARLLPMQLFLRGSWSCHSDPLLGHYNTAFSKSSHTFDGSFIASVHRKWLN